MATPIPTNQAPFSLFEIALATGGTITRRGLSWQEPTRGVFTDSRAVTPGSVFVALRGESHDAHAFVDTAIQNGAHTVVVERGRTESAWAATVVEVRDTLEAWGELARAHLTRWRVESVDGRVVAITGSTGKTTTKELTAALLSHLAPTHFTAGNLNNRVGVPAVIFALQPQHRYCVLEMGMSLPGELDAITSFARPDVSVIVNVGVAHAEGVGGRDGVMHEKGAVYRALGADGIAIVNVDDECVQNAAKVAAVRHMETFGRGHDGAPSSVPRYRLVERTPERGGSRVVMVCAGRELSLHLPLPGEAAALDLTAAIAAQEAASGEALSAESLERALASVKLAGRNVVRTLRNDVVVLDDTYNANPASMRAALSTLDELAGTRRKIAVLGEMKELGPLAEAEHDALGDAIADAGVTLAIGCGGLVDRALERAKARGVEALACTSTDEAARVVSEHVRAGDALLVKGSRSTRTERVVEALERAFG